MSRPSPTLSTATTARAAPPKIDDGYENVFINVRHLTADQKREFEEQATRIPNSSFLQEVNGHAGLTQIG